MEVSDQRIRHVAQYRLYFLLLLRGQLLASLETAGHNQQTRLEATEVVEGLFPAPKSRANSKNQGKNDGNADDGQIKIVLDFILDDRKRSGQADD
jgi:hypothetical protein